MHHVISKQYFEIWFREYPYVKNILYDKLLIISLSVYIIITSMFDIEIISTSGFKMI